MSAPASTSSSLNGTQGQATSNNGGVGGGIQLPSIKNWDPALTNPDLVGAPTASSSAGPSADDHHHQDSSVPQQDSTAHYPYQLGGNGVAPQGQSSFNSYPTAYSLPPALPAPSNNGYGHRASPPPVQGQPGGGYAPAYRYPPLQQPLQMGGVNPSPPGSAYGGNSRPYSPHPVQGGPPPPGQQRGGYASPYSALPPSQHQQIQAHQQQLQQIQQHQQQMHHHQPSDEWATKRSVRDWDDGTGGHSGAGSVNGEYDDGSGAKKKKVIKPTMEEMASGSPANKTPIKKFVCPHASCGRAFARNFNLQSHIKSHLGVRDFNCPECPKSFSRRHDCARHCIAVHRYDKETGKPRPEGQVQQHTG